MSNGAASIYIATDTTRPDLIIYSDASGTQGFGYTETKSLQYGLGTWTLKDLKEARRELENSSTFLEILAIAIAIRSLAKPNLAIEVHCDSQPAIFALERRYYKGAVEGQNIIIGLDKFCRDWGLATFFRHTPRTDPTIQLVDSLSKGVVPRDLERIGILTNNIRIQAFIDKLG